MLVTKITLTFRLLNCALMLKTSYQSIISNFSYLKVDKNQIKVKIWWQKLGLNNDQICKSNDISNKKLTDDFCFSTKLIKSNGFKFTTAGLNPHGNLESVIMNEAI